MGSRLGHSSSNSPVTTKQAAAREAAKALFNRHVESNVIETKLSGLGAPSTTTTSIPSQNQSTFDRGKNSKRMRLDYCEFNLSTLQDTKGGYLAPALNEEEIQPQKIQYVGDETNLDDELRCNNDKAIPVKSLAPLICHSMDIDFTYLDHYGLRVCASCIKEFPDRFSLLTKTECKADYLLTESEINDKSLPFWEKQNPHKSTYSRMKLYCRMQVENFAWRKWGDEEGLDREFNRRDEEKRERDALVFKKKLTEMRIKTKTSDWMNQLDLPDICNHVWISRDSKNSQQSTQKCRRCGIVAEFEII